MDNNELFMIASKNKIRFEYKGFITTEDLWDLSLNSLDEIYGKLKKQEAQYSTESLLSSGSKQKERNALDLKLGIVKAVFDSKMADKNQKENEAKKKAQNQKILEIMNRKKDAALENLTIEQLEKMLEE